MATASVVHIDPHHLPVASVPKLSDESAAELSRLMQENHQKHHVYFNERGFHNHIGHHLLSVYALGGTPDQIKHHFSHNAQYMLPQFPELVEVQTSYKDPKIFMEALSNQKNYTNFLSFFTSEIQGRGVPATLEEYLFKGDEKAERMFQQLFASIIHPLIHLGLAIEFNVPSMVAEALAWTAIHQNEIGSFVVKTEEAAKSSPAPSPLPGLMSLYRDVASQTVRDGAKPSDLSSIVSLSNGAEDEIINVTKRYRVPQDQLEDRIKEALNTIAYVTMGQQLPPYTPKVDFFAVHMLNASVFFPALASVMSPANVIRTMETFVRVSLGLYAAMGAVELRPEYYLSFARDPAKRAAQGGSEYADWDALYAKGNALDDDGHVVKAIRALKGVEIVAGQQTTWEEPLKKADLLDVAAVLMRSTENEKDYVASKGPTDQWVRGAGSAQAWSSFKKIE